MLIPACQCNDGVEVVKSPHHKSLPRLLIIQPVMKGYRLPFFHGLSERLAAAGVALEVAYGTPWAEEAKRGDNVELPPPLGRKVESRMLGGKLLWLPAFDAVAAASHVIVEHANKNAINYPLALANALGVKRVAYWGHGRDRQSDPSSGGERFKRASLHWADWWFAYTGGAAAYVAEQGFAPGRITTVGNAIDTRQLREQVASVTPAERESLLAGLGLAADGPRLVYCGSLYANKRLDLMLPAIDAVQARLPALQLIVIGGGPLADEVRRFAEARPWVRYVGPKFGREKAALLSLAALWLNPGLVGLGVLDAFSAGLPLITCEASYHSPEIEYLEHGGNGLVLPADVAALSAALGDLLAAPDRLAALQQGARAAAERHSIEAMIDNFAQGVGKWLNV